MRVFAFIASGVTVAAVCLVLEAMHFNAASVRQWYYRALSRIVGLRIVVRGEQSSAHPRLVIANHISYFDIPLLGAVVRGEFVARADMAAWLFVGFMAKGARVVFVDRRRTATATARDQIQERLEAGDTLIMFPESTSGDGNYMKPFKSALFTVAERQITGRDGIQRPVTVQPVSIAYTRLNGMPLGVGWRAFVAWYGDMELPPHLWQVAKLGTITAEVTFHPPVLPADFPNRKALSAHCERVVRNGFARLLAGRETV